MTPGASLADERILQFRDVENTNDDNDQFMMKDVRVRAATMEE
jgi:hypothetical protein